MAARKRTAKSKAKQSNRADNYRHNEAESLLRPDVGAQVEYSRANKPKPAKTYRFDSSLSPALEWDGQNPAREQGEALIAEIGRGLTQINADLQKDDPICVHLRQSAAEILHLIQRLKAMSGPFLNWAGKAERLSFDVPTLPLFVHERLSTKAIIETLKGHKRDQQMTLFDLFGDPEHSIADQALRAYEHKDKWVNRMVLGDSLVVMNSLLHYENLGGQVQMIYMDPPYGIKYGSNFQPFVRKRDVSHNDDDDMTREPETVQAYRDTWEVGVHSYLTYLRDRLLMCRELLHLTGSVFVQISDENLHHVRELTDETFGADNFCGLITLTKAASQSSKLLASINDFVLWYAKDKEHVKYRQLYVPRPQIDTPTRRYICIETPDGKVIDLSLKQKLGLDAVPQGRWLRLVALTSQTGSDSSRFPYEFKGNVYRPPGTRGWSTSKEGLDNVRKAGRMFGVGTTLNYKNFHDDFPYRPIVSLWDDIRSSGFGDEKLYVVQTQTDVLQRCILMTTDRATWRLTQRAEAAPPPTSPNNGADAGSPATPAACRSPWPGNGC